MASAWVVVGDIREALGAVKKSYETSVVKITDLPEAFKHIHETLPTIELLFPRIHAENFDAPPNTLFLQRAEGTAKQLSSIFGRLANGIRTDDSMRTWADVQHLYRDAVDGNESNLVESLMMTFLMEFQCLISFSKNDEIAMRSSQTLIARLAASMTKLSTVAPTLCQAELETDNALRIQQIIRDHATGFLNQMRKASAAAATAGTAGTR